MKKNQPLLFFVLIFHAIFLMVVSACSLAAITGGKTRENGIVYRIGPVIVGNINSQDYLFMALSFDSYTTPDILILDLNDPGKPHRVAFQKGPDKTEIQDLKLYESILYALDAKRLRVFDVSSPAAPQELARLEDIPAWEMAISGQNAYIDEANEEITIADITTPENPRVVGSLKIQSRSAQKMLVDNSRLFWKSGEGIHIVDISNATSPEELSLIQDAAYRPPERIRTPTRLPPEEAELRRQDFRDYTVQGNTVFVTCGPAGLKNFDISEPASPRQIGLFKASESPNSSQIILGGERAYLFDQNPVDTLYVLDISDPHLPRTINSIDLSENSVYRGFVNHGDYVYAFGITPASSRGPIPPLVTAFFEVINVSSGTVTRLIL